MADAPQQLGDHRQVSGSDLTLSEAIRRGEVPRLPLVGWNDWQPWRRDHGRVPTMEANGFLLPAQIETSLGRAIMNELYGEDWAMLDTLREADECRHVGARRLRAAEQRREELLGAGALPRLRDVPPAPPPAGIPTGQETMPPVATEDTPSSVTPGQTERGPVVPERNVGFVPNPFRIDTF